ncbi:MAG: hypothetical protein AABX99_00480 [Nanoarchaeota archaeon]
MKKEEVYKYFNGFEKNSIHRLKWKTRNGELDELVRFGGFDDVKNPRIIQSGGVLLEVERLDYGYDSIKSINPECPDGYCFGRIRENEIDGMC